MRKIYEFFNSLKLTVYLILAITTVTMAGSMVLYVHPEIFGEMDQALLLRWLLSTGPQHLTYTWWLYLLVLMVVVLGINTLVCTVERLPKLIRRYRNPLMNLRDMETGGTGREFVMGAGATEAMTAFLRRDGYAVFTEGDRMYAEKHRWLPFIPYLVHAGIMVFMIGHLISGLYGYRNSGLVIFEGQSVKSPGGDYMLRLDKFNIEQYPDGSLKKYGSRITALKDGKEIKQGTVTANTPMFVEGGAVYQRQFGQDLSGIILFAQTRSTGFKGNVKVPKDTGYGLIPGTDCIVSIERLVPDFAVDGSGQPYTRSEEMSNPALLVALHRGKNTNRGWLFQKEPIQDTFNDKDVSLKFADVEMRTYSTFDVNRDPSAITVLIASLIVMFGTITTLYFRRERVWAQVDEEGGRAQAECTDDELYEKMSGKWK